MNRTIKKFVFLVVTTVGIAALSNGNAMNTDAVNPDFDNIPTNKLPVLLKEAQQSVREERREARETGDSTGLDIAQDRVNAIKNEIRDRK